MVESLATIGFGLRSMFCRGVLQVRGSQRCYSRYQSIISSRRVNNAHSRTVGTLVTSPGGVFGQSSNNPNCSSLSSAGRGGSGVRAWWTLFFLSGFSPERPKRGISRLQGRTEMRVEVVARLGVTNLSAKLFRLITHAMDGDKTWQSRPGKKSTIKGKCMH